MHQGEHTVRWTRRQATLFPEPLPLPPPAVAFPSALQLHLAPLFAPSSCRATTWSRRCSCSQRCCKSGRSTMAVSVAALPARCLALSVVLLLPLIVPLPLSRACFGVVGDRGPHFRSDHPCCSDCLLATFPCPPSLRACRAGPGVRLGLLPLRSGAAVPGARLGRRVWRGHEGGGGGGGRGRRRGGG